MAEVAAQQPTPSPAALSESAQPVRVVCVADAPDAFLGDETFRDRVLARLPAALAPASISWSSPMWPAARWPAVATAFTVALLMRTAAAGMAMTRMRQLHPQFEG